MILQRTPEWRQARLGKATSSRIADVVAKTKSGWGASRYSYMAELITERLTGVPVEGYVSAAMQWGIDHEDDCIAAYEFLNNVEVERVGFVPHPHIAMAGASPDGYVGTDGLIEMKCPASHTHIDTLLGGSISGAYISQMQWQMSTTGRAWIDYCSYDPRMPESMQLHVTRVKRDEYAIGQLEREVEAFLAEVSGKVEELNRRYMRVAA